MYHGRTATFAGTLVIVMLTIVPAFARSSPIHTVAATKPQPPSSTSGTWAKAYSIPYSYSLAESVAQTPSGGYLVGALCTAGASSLEAMKLKCADSLALILSSSSFRISHSPRIGTVPPEGRTIGLSD